jgi:hypothetical protein
VEGEHELEIPGESREEGHLGRAGIREQRCQPALAQDVDDSVAYRGSGQSSSLTQMI